MRFATFILREPGLAHWCGGLIRRVLRSGSGILCNSGGARLLTSRRRLVSSLAPPKTYLYLLFLLLALSARAQPNSWTLGSSWFWDDSIGWSLGIRPTTNHWVFITNANTKTVTLNNIAAAIPSTMTVSNLTLAGVTGATNTLLLNSATNGAGFVPLRVLNALTVSTNAALLITNSALDVRAEAGVPGGGGFTVDGGAVTMQSGLLTVTNNFPSTIVGNTG